MSNISTPSAHHAISDGSPSDRASSARAGNSSSPHTHDSHDAPAAESGHTAMQRMTKQRQAVLDELTRVHNFRSAQQIFDDLQRNGQKVGLATVYRNLQALADDHRVDMLRSGDGESLFRVCENSSHHHHLVCSSCGYTEEISQSEIESWVHEVAQSHRFTQVTHSMDLFGLCANCTARFNAS